MAEKHFIRILRGYTVMTSANAHATCPKKRNGAGIAADPTLTGVWAPRDTLRLAFHTHPEGGGYIARRSRRRRFLQRLGMISGTFPLPSSGSETATANWLITQSLQCRSISVSIKARPPLRPVRSRTFAASPIGKTIRPKTSGLPSLHRAASRHRVETVPKSPFHAGCYAFDPKGQSPCR